MEKTNIAHLVTGSASLDFRVHLQTELERRVQVNPRYSLRRFAQYLSLEPSFLSKLLRAKKTMTPQLIERLGLRLGLSLSEISGYIEKTEKSAVKKNETSDTFYRISADTFRIIEDQSHYLVLELIKTNGFQGSIKWISQKIGRSQPETFLCVERLVRVGLLKIDQDNRWIDLSGGFSSHALPANLTSESHRRSQLQILDLAKSAIDTVDVAQRDQSSMMMATSSRRIKIAKRLIKTFRRQLCAFLEAEPEKDAVYQLSVSLFPLTPTSPSGESQIRKKRS